MASLGRVHLLPAGICQGHLGSSRGEKRRTKPNNKQRERNARPSDGQIMTCWVLALGAARPSAPVPRLP
eukprot:7268803-Pyramimonas_sp.AAC.1